MNKDFEFKQLLRAYRSGIITEATFENEMCSLENGAGTNGARTIRFLDKTYNSEREAILDFLDKASAAEGVGATGITKWVGVCKTECVKGGLRMVCEREAYHSRVFEQRLIELGGSRKEGVNEEARKYIEYVSDPNMTDAAKLLRVTSIIPDPKKAVQPIFDFCDQIKDDQQTKEMLLLFGRDELSSATWLNEACALLNGKNTGKTTEAKPQASM
jgi:hypothetical protein